MSWWDTAGLANFATQASAALKTAQQKIDKVLDIKEEAGAAKGSAPQTSATGSSDVGSGEFWSSWLSASGPTANEPSPFLSSASENQRQNASDLSDRAKLMTPPRPESLSMKIKTESVKSSQWSQPLLEVPTSQSEPSLKSSTTADRQPSGSLTMSKSTAPLKLGLKTKRQEEKAAAKQEQPREAGDIQNLVEEKLKLEKAAEEQLLKLLNDGQVQSNVKTTHIDYVDTVTDTPSGGKIDRKEWASREAFSRPSLEGVIGSEDLQSKLSMSQSTAGLREDDSAWEDLQMSSMLESMSAEAEDLQADGNSFSDDQTKLEGLYFSTVNITTDESSGKKTEVKPSNCIENIEKTDESSKQTVDILDDKEMKISSFDGAFTGEFVEQDIEVVYENTDFKDCDTSEVNSSAVIKFTTSGGSETQEERSQNYEQSQDLTLTLHDTVSELEKSHTPMSEHIEQEAAPAIECLEKSTESTHITDQELVSDGYNKPPVSALSHSCSTVSSDKVQDISLSQHSSMSCIDTKDSSGDTDSEYSSMRDSSTMVCSSSTDNTVMNSSLMSRSDDLSGTDATVSSSEESGGHTRERGESECTVIEAECEVSRVKNEAVSEDYENVGSEEGNQGSPSGSFLKNMLEEAMTESLKDGDSHADSQSSSDLVRVGSSQNSGHTSADEFETTTSSDIEIISHISTPNGENRFPFEMAQFRQAFAAAGNYGSAPPGQRRSPPGHRRSDSGSSGYDVRSLRSSKEGSSLTDTQRESLEAAVVERTAAAYQHEKDRLLKADISQKKAVSQLENLKLEMAGTAFDQKMAEMMEVLEAREKRLVELSRSNMDLQETNNILKNQMQQMEEAREAELTDVNTLTEEFTKRIAEAERKLQMTLKERDSMKKRLQEVETDLTQKSDTSSTAEKILREKEQQISELLEEGEKLSKQQLQTNSIVKKLRAKEKENETLIKSLNDKLDKKTTEMDRLQKVLDNKCDVEKKNTETILQLQAAVVKQDQELERLKNELEDSQEKARSTQAALDSSYKEIADLHKANVARVSEVQNAALSAEVQAKQQLEYELERCQLDARKQKEALVQQIEDFRLSLSRMEREQGRREDILRQEISDLQQRLQEAEDRNQELTHSVSSATRPLLRQIENLQSTYTAHSSSYEAAEKNLMDRLSDTQHQLASAQERERACQEELLDVSARLSSLESQNSTLRQEKSKLQVQLEVQGSRLQLLEDNKHKETAQFEVHKHDLESQMTTLKKEKILLENQLEMEKVRVETEKKKFQSLQEQLRDRELQLTQYKSSRSSTPQREVFHGPDSPGYPGSMSSSMMGSFMSNADDLDRSLITTPSGAKMSLYDSIRQAGSGNVLEYLQAQLKQKDGELQQLMSEIHELEKTRESLARELVNVSNKNQELEESVVKYTQLQKTHTEVVQRYNALLQMYGEKEERVQELQLDLVDLKEMYRNQIDELLRKS